MAEKIIVIALNASGSNPLLQGQSPAVNRELFSLSLSWAAVRESVARLSDFDDIPQQERLHDSGVTNEDPLLVSHLYLLILTTYVNFMKILQG